MASNNASAALALKATLVGGVVKEAGSHAAPSISATPHGYSDDAPPGILDLDDTIGAPGAAASVGPAAAAGMTAGRTTPCSSSERWLRSS